MQSESAHSSPGPVALVGSGEYLNVMDTTDGYLLETLGGADNARVALLPTASGLEANKPTYWNNLGLHHFSQLGVQDIRATTILDRASAHQPEQLALLQGANFYYFSGGNPQHTIETLRDTPAWEIISSAYQQGAVLAGCSAGAMMLSRYTIAMREVMSGQKPRWIDALAIVPGLVVFPHFDRMSRFLDRSELRLLITDLPDGILVAGIDENTALVRLQTDANKARWRVMGQQAVHLFEKNAPDRTLQVGEEVVLLNP